MRGTEAATAVMEDNTPESAEDAAALMAEESCSSHSAAVSPLPRIPCGKRRIAESICCSFPDSDSPLTKRHASDATA